MSTQADALRQVAELLEAHPDLPAPYVTVGTSFANVFWQLMIAADLDGLAEQKTAAAAIIRAVGGKWDKQDGSSDFYFRQQRGGLELTVGVKREAVCERIVTGTVTVTIPAQEARPQQTVEREVVEWRCEPLLAEAAS